MRCSELLGAGAEDASARWCAGSTRTRLAGRLPGSASSGRLVHRLGVGALADLRQLLRVAEEQHALGAA